MRRQSGVSLIEMAVAVAIIASGLLVALTVLPRTYASLRQSQEGTLATYLGQKVLEDYKSVTFGDLLTTFGVPASVADPRAPGPPPPPVDYAAPQRTVQIFSIINGNAAHVTLTWRAVVTYPWAPPRESTCTAGPPTASRASSTARPPARRSE